MTIDEIIPDEELTMTQTLKRAFLLEGCNPACHCCEKEIVIGEVFKLAFIEHKNIEYVYSPDVSEDEMLCSVCTPEMLKKKMKVRHKEKLAYINRRGFSRIHKYK